MIVDQRFMHQLTVLKELVTNLNTDAHDSTQLISIKDIENHFAIKYWKQRAKDNTASS